jgi:hypothetical protein
MHLDLTKEEAALLRELLDRALADLREEVYKTEATAWKRALKDREHVLEDLVAKVAAPA